MASRRSRGQPLITPRLCRSRYQISMVARRSITARLTITARLIGEKDEKLAVKFLKTGLVSKITIKKLLTMTEDKSMVSIKSYILEQLNNSDTSKENFYI